MASFKDSIITLIDLDNFRSGLNAKSRQAVQVMRDFHTLIAEQARRLKAHEEICFWQDSVLLLGRVNRTRASYEHVMMDVLKLKLAIEGIHRCHAISIKGQTFRGPRVHVGGTPRTVYLSASSLAFTNCFDVEHSLEAHKADWYIDSRITKKIRTRAADVVQCVALLPGNIPRPIHVYHNLFR